MTQSTIRHVRPQNASEALPVLCPSCSDHDCSILYEARRIPVHSCLLMDTREQALNYPRGDLRLGFCESCGFVYNTAFQSDVHEYSPRYEETQGFSPMFNAFARSLAQRLVDLYDLRGKTVLEIGCGKGEFLALLCQLGSCQGIGVDPSYVPQRLPAEHTRPIRFIQDFYGPKYADLAADFVICRHTLEHIAPTKHFVQSLRRTFGDREGMLVFFEVPDVLRVLKEGAFWDIYYEHCSYFSCGSQARLFRRCGFEVTDVALDYGGQYILQTARPAKNPTLAHQPLENDLSLLREAASRFPRLVTECIEFWRAYVHQAVAQNQRVVLWGSGSKGVAFLTTLQVGDAIQYVVDINPHKHGKFMPGSGQEIVSPAFLAQYRPDRVILMNPMYADEVRADLAKLGLQPEVVPV